MAQLQDYYPFGDVRIDDLVSGEDNDYKFTGKEKDDETGLYYYGARYYNSGIGRFISRDTWQGKLENPPSLNRYSYVTNNPLKYIDPKGNSPLIPIALAAYAAYVAHDQGFASAAEVSPVIGDANDLAIVATGKSLFTGEQYSWGERALLSEPVWHSPLVS